MKYRLIILSCIAIFGISCFFQDVALAKLVELPPYDAGVPSLLVDIPSGWTDPVRVKNSDFDVYYISSIGNTAEIGIYIGFHPVRFRDRMNDLKVKKEFGNIDGNPILWFVWQQKYLRHKHYRETLLGGLAPEKPDLLIHIFLRSDSEFHMKQAIEIAETLHVRTERR